MAAVNQLQQKRQGFEDRISRLEDLKFRITNLEHDIHWVENKVERESGAYFIALLSIILSAIAVICGMTVLLLH